MHSNSLEGKLVSQSKTVMTEMIMPNDTNPMGNLMGGYLMRWMDIACAVCAARHCGSQVATASVDHIYLFMSR
jgi:acyl-CoA hydrolase